MKAKGTVMCEIGLWLNILYHFLCLVQVQLRQKGYAQVRPSQGLNLWLLDHDSIFHAQDPQCELVLLGFICGRTKAHTSSLI